jgi:hypothetical protein
MTKLTQIKTRIAQLQETITGVRAYTEAPSSLPDADLPIFLNFIVAATYAQTADTQGEETRTFLMRLYVTRKGQGIDGEAEAKVTEYFALVRDLFNAHPRLGNGTAGSALNFIRKAEYAGDSGVMVLPFAGEEFLGAEFRLNVTSIVPRQIAKYE